MTERLDLRRDLPTDQAMVITTGGTERADCPCCGTVAPYVQDRLRCLCCGCEHVLDPKGIWSKCDGPKPREGRA